MKKRGRFTIKKTTQSYEKNFQIYNTNELLLNEMRREDIRNKLKQTVHQKMNASDDNI